MDETASLRAEAARLHRAGQFEAAEHCYNQILTRDAADLDARHMLGLLRLQQGRAAEALAMIAPLLAEALGHADIRTHHGVVLHELGRHQEALADFGQALALKPDHATTLLYRGNLLAAMGRHQEALADYERLLQRVPGDAEARFRRGRVLWQMGQFNEATASFEKAAALQPHHFGAQFNLGAGLTWQKRYREAFNAYERARALAPHHPNLLDAAAGAVLGMCDLARWEEYQALVVAAVKARSAVIAPLTFLPFCDDGGLRRLCSETFIAAQVPELPPLRRGDASVHDRIRIAYLSADFRQHATAELMAGLVERHDRARFEITAISFGYDDGSAMRARLEKGFDRFVDVRDKSDAEVAAWLAAQQIDIAVDLKGHTDHARPGILSARPCPVQVHYLGYPGTFGAPWLDYILADAVVLPFADQPFYSEKIVHLPHCYQVNDSARVIGETPSRAAAGLPPDGFVFCCFNATWKISPAIFAIWMRLLKAVPGSLLWLLEDNPDAVDNLKAAAAAQGVDPARLVFAPRVLPAQHLARQRLADLFLDTLPYNAHTTASDALWAGLPLLTCRGSQFDGRVAASLLLAMGLPELVTASLEDYETLALALARDPPRLAALRNKIDRNRHTSPLFDTDLFRRHIEAAYERMLDIARRRGAPQSFAIPP